MITTAEKKQIVTEFGKEFGKGENDSGSSSVQVAILTSRIMNLKEHFAGHKKDYHSNRGLMKMIGQRRSLLKYIQRKDVEKYQSLIKKLGMRK